MPNENIYKNSNNNLERINSYIDLIFKDFTEYLNEEKLLRIKEIFQNTISKEYNESRLLQEMFKVFINSNIFLEYPNLNEALIEICIIDFLKANNIFPEYQISNPELVVFLRKKLEKIVDNENLIMFISNGNFEQFIELIKESKEEFINELQLVEKHETKYQKLINSIASLSPKNSEELANILIKLFSRVETEKEAIEIILEVIPTIMPEISKQTSDLINEYLNKNNSYSM